MKELTIAEWNYQTAEGKHANTETPCFFSVKTPVDSAPEKAHVHRMTTRREVMWIGNIVKPDSRMEL